MNKLKDTIVELSNAASENEKIQKKRKYEYVNSSLEIPRTKLEWDKVGSRMIFELNTFVNLQDNKELDINRQFKKRKSDESIGVFYLWNMQGMVNQSGRQFKSNRIRSVKPFGTLPPYYTNYQLRQPQLNLLQQFNNAEIMKKIENANIVDAKIQFDKVNVAAYKILRKNPAVHKQILIDRAQSFQNHFTKWYWLHTRDTKHLSLGLIARIREHERTRLRIEFGVNNNQRPPYGAACIFC